MTVFEIEDIKNFMSLLFKGEAFDRLLMVEAEIKMAATFRIDGSINKAFLDEDEVDETGTLVSSQSFARWSGVKKLCFDMIKGKKLPLKMHIMMKKPVANEQDGMLSYGLNIMYEGGKLQLVANVATVIFSLERPDQEKWNTYVANILKGNDIIYNILN